MQRPIVITKEDEALLSRPGSKAGRIQRKLLILVREHARDNAIPTNKQFLWYEAIMRKIVPKHSDMKRPDNDINGALLHLREVELVPWDWIEDETRVVDDFTGYPTILDGAIAQLEYIRLDPWDGKPPFVIMESRSLRGALRPVLEKYAVRSAATNGQCRGFLHNKVAPYLGEGEGKGDRVLYVGDFDWQGIEHIEANTKRVLESLVGPLNWKRIALTKEQVREYRLRRFQIMKEDTRYRKDDPRRHQPAIECEALKQTVIIDIVREALDALLPEPLETVLAREEKQRARTAADLEALEEENEEESNNEGNK